MELRFHPRHLQLNIEKSNGGVSLEDSPKGGQRRKSGGSRFRNPLSPECWVVADNSNAIAGQSHVKLKAVTSMLQGKIKGSQSVLSSRA